MEYFEFTDSLNKQLEASLHGDFKVGRSLCNHNSKFATDHLELFKRKATFNYIAFKQVRESLTNCIRAEYNRGWYEMMDGNLLEGFKLMNQGRQVDIWGNKPIQTNKPEWTGQDLCNKTVLVVGEAGFGDQILFVRFVSRLMRLGAKVIVACDDYGLAAIFSRMEGVSAVINSKVHHSVFYDYWIPMMELPVPLGIEYGDLSGSPYIVANSDIVDKYKKLVKSDKLKVGIRWLSMPKEGVCNTLGDAYKSRQFPAELMFDAVENDKVQLFSLQRDVGVEQLPKMSGIIDLERHMTDWEQTAGIIANLDLVISSCTSVAHLAAAMGKPTWIVVPLMAYYTWALPGKTTPWYDTVTLFRQEIYGSWFEPFEKLKESLDAYTA